MSLVITQNSTWLEIANSFVQSLDLIEAACPPSVLVAAGEITVDDAFNYGVRMGKLKTLASSGKNITLEEVTNLICNYQFTLDQSANLSLGELMLKQDEFVACLKNPETNLALVKTMDRYANRNLNRPDVPTTALQRAIQAQQKLKADKEAAKQKQIQDLQKKIQEAQQKINELNGGGGGGGSSDAPPSGGGGWTGDPGTGGGGKGGGGGGVKVGELELVQF